MARERVKRYEDAGISKNRYLELKSIARQYDELCHAEAKLRRGEVDRSSSGSWSRPDPTGNAAVGNVVRSREAKIRAIEEAARAAGTELYPWLMRCVVRGESFESVHPPCGRAQFHRIRRLFFIELDKRLL